MTTFTRPNGKKYRPRNPDQRLLIPWGDITSDNPYGCIIIGTSANGRRSLRGQSMRGETEMPSGTPVTCGSCRAKAGDDRG